MRSIGRVFVQGLVTLIPIILTVYLLWLVVGTLEKMVARMLTLLLPESLYIPGLGLVISFVIIYALGLMLNYYFTRSAVQYIEKQLLKIPLVKAIYSPLRDIFQLFSKKNQNFGQPVLVELAGVRAFGLITREDFRDIPTSNALLKSGDWVAVFIPLSYQIGGYTLIVKKEQITPLDLPVEKTMSYAITGWVKAQSNASDSV